MAHTESSHSGSKAHAPSREVQTFLDLRAKGRANPYVALLGLKVFEPMEIQETVEKGLGFDAFRRLQRSTEISARDLAEAAQIPARTLARRQKQGRLAPGESDRVLRVSRVFGLALELFEGDEPAARAFLFSPQRALGNRRPIDLLRSEVGTREIETLVVRLEHGVFS